MRFIFKRGGRSGGIPDHVAAGSPSGDSRFIDPADALLELTLEDPVQLESLASGDPERSVAEVTRDSVMGEILLRAQGPAGNFERTMNIQALSRFCFFRGTADRDRPVDRYRGTSGVDTLRRKSETRPREEFPESCLARHDSRP